jgi:hypothetical protein
VSAYGASYIYRQKVNASEDVVRAVEAQWGALPNYMEGSKERILPVCDVSGSMYNGNGLAIKVSLALGLYISERNEGIFKDALVTFSASSKMHYLQGSLSQRIAQISEDNMNTDLQSVFSLLLQTAVKHNIPESEMPTKLLIISDMEFDYVGAHNTNLDRIKDFYATKGYTMPEIIFWNVNGRPNNVPTHAHDPRIGLVSGFSPSILQSILLGAIETPLQLMKRTVNAERYLKITA